MFCRDVLLPRGLPMHLGLDFDVEQTFRDRLPKSKSRIHTACSLEEEQFYLPLESTKSNCQLVHYDATNLNLRIRIYWVSKGRSKRHKKTKQLGAV